MPEATEFIQANKIALKRVPLAVFWVHIMNLGTDEKSSKKRQAYLDPVRSMLPIVDEAFFAGKGVDPETPSRFERLMASVMQIPP